MNIEYTDAQEISPHNSNDISPMPRAILVGSIAGGSAIKVITLEGTTVTLTGVLAGHIYPICVSRVFATGTTASSLFGLY